MKPRLLVLTSTYPRWADDTEPGFVHELSKRLTNEFDVTVLAPHAAGSERQELMDDVSVYRFRYAPERLEQLAYEGGISERIRHKGWRVLLVPFFLFCQYWATRRLIQKLRPDAIHAHWIFPQGFIAVLANKLRLRPVPILCTIHGADWYRLRGRLWDWVKRFALKRCSVVAPVSATLRQDMEKTGWAAGRLAEPMPMGIHIPERVSPLCERDPNSLFFVGRLVPKKGLDVLLDAMLILKKAKVSVTLTVAGGGEEALRYQNKAKELGVSDQVRFLGPINHSQVYEQMGRSAICVVPSLEAGDGDQEGLGLVLLEAIANGCYPVASDIPVFRMAFAHSTSVRFFDTGNSISLAKELECLIIDINAACVVNEASDIVDFYRWSSVVWRYLKQVYWLVGKC